MSKLAKLYLAAAAARVSNEDIDESALPNPGSNDTPVTDAQPEVVPDPTPARPVEAAPAADAAPAEAPTVPVVEQPESAADTVAATEDAGADVPTPPAETSTEPVIEHTEIQAEVIPADQEDEIVNAETPVERATEFVEAQVAAREEQEALESLKTSLEGLKNIHQLLTHLNATGGVSKDVMSFTRIGLEAYTDGLGMPQIMLGVSMESFEDSNQRQEVSLEHLEYFINRCEAVVPEIEQNIESSNQQLIRRASLESLPMDGDAGCDDEMDPTALAVAQNEVAREREFEASEEVDGAVDGIERVREEVVAQNEAGGLSQEAIVAASLALEAFTDALGLPEVTLAENLDEFADGARVQVPTEPIDVAMEAAMDVVKNVGKAIAGRVRKTKIFIKNALGMLNGTLPKTIEALEKFLAGLDPKMKTSGTVSASGLAKKLHDGGKIPTNIPQYLINFCGFANRFMGPYLVAAHSNLVDNMAAIGKLPRHNSLVFQKGLGDLARAWKDPRSALSASDLNATIPGEGRVFSDRESPKYKGDVKEVQFFIDLSTKNVLHGTARREERKLSDRTKTLPALSVADIKRIGEELLKLLKGIKTSDLEVSQNVIQNYWMVDYFLRTANANVIREAMLVRNAFLWNSLAPALEFGWSMARSCVTVTRSFMEYAKASMKTAGKPSTESHTEVSMEGADPKQLKSGIAVRFAHGHGKVAKVFTAPFLFGKKQHHASKDDPRYLVKADKTGNQSIHKASALTIV